MAATIPLAKRVLGKPAWVANRVSAYRMEFASLTARDPSTTTGAAVFHARPAVLHAKVTNLAVYAQQTSLLLMECAINVGKCAFSVQVQIHALNALLATISEQTEYAQANAQEVRLAILECVSVKMDLRMGILASRSAQVSGGQSMESVSPASLIVKYAPTQQSNVIDAEMVRSLSMESASQAQVVRKVRLTSSANA